MQSTIKHFFKIVLTCSLIVCSSLIGIDHCAIADEDAPGISEDEIRIGQSCALTGIAGEFGIGMRDGALTYFKYINDTGGIDGKKIKLITYDDAYNPERCQKNTNNLIDNDKVFLLFGYTGAPTAEKIIPIINEKKIPLFAPLTGAEFLRNPVNPYIFNLRASYYQETEEMVDRLIKEKSIRRISVFYQNDAYGRAGLEGLRLALKKRDLEILNETYYEPGETDVTPASKALLATRPGAVIMIGATTACANLIKTMRNNGSKAIFIGVSIVGAEALGKQTANQGIGVSVTQVVPYPFYRKIPIVAEYNQLNKKYMKAVEPTFVGMEGFIAAKALCKILREVPKPITREKFLKAAEDQFYTDLSGFSFSFSAESHQGSDLVYFTQIGPGGFVAPIKKLSQLYDYSKSKSKLFSTDTP